VPNSEAATPLAGAEADNSKPPPGLPRRLVIAAWATGPAAVYALLSLAHALLIEGVLTVDIGFGRSLAFWVVATYLALLLWGFLPPAPSARVARPAVVYPLLGVGMLGLLICGGFTLAWLAAHWRASVGVSVLGSLVAMVLAGLGTLWIADRTERRSS
jgi:hypothetical protein